MKYLVPIILLVVAEIGLAIWQHAPIAPSTAPVFSYPPAAANFGRTEAMVRATEVYNADRGGECRISTPDGAEVTVFYFEWDQLKAGPMMSIAGHSPDECNVVAGFKLLGIAPRRCYQVRGGGTLEFDATVFEDPKGGVVHMFKLAWLQGLGSRDFREGANRIARLKNSFVRHLGAARVLQGAIAGARDADHAWQLFSDEVLDDLQWRD